MKNDRRLVWLVGALVVVGVAALAWWLAGRRQPEHSGESAPAVAVAIARVQTIDVTVPATGRLGPSAGAESKLGFAVSGRLSTVDVHVGEPVSARQPLASLDDTSLSLGAQQAQADAQAAQAQVRAVNVDRFSTKLALDEHALEREQRLYEGGVAARKDVEAARAQLAADRADAEAAVADRSAVRAQSASAQARAALAQRDVANATLRAPIDGIVTGIFHHSGEAVDPSVAIVSIAPSNESEVTLTVASADALRVRAGDEVRLQAHGGSGYAGRVVGVSGAVDPTTQSAQVAVSANVPSIFAGTALDAQIVVARDRGIVVPKDAIVVDPSTGKTLVFVQSKDREGDAAFDAREVTIVFENETSAEVRGLHAGERIAATGAFELLAPSQGGD